MTATFEQAKRRSEHITGISNVAYDLMVVLTSKQQDGEELRGFVCHRLQRLQRW